MQTGTREIFGALVGVEVAVFVGIFVGSGVLVGAKVGRGVAVRLKEEVDVAMAVDVGAAV